MLNYQDVIDIGLSPDKATLQARLVAAAADLGFGLSGGTLIRGRLGSGKETVHAVGNTPEAFLQASRSLDVGMRDPLLTAMLARDGCFTYDQAFYARAGAGDLWDNQAAFGYRAGMAIAAHEFSHMEVFSFGVDGPDALPGSPGARLELEGNLRLISVYAHEAAKRLWTAPCTVDLNRLDGEALNTFRWAADAAVVSYRKGRVVISSPHQAEQVRRATRRLGAHNPTQALLAVIQGGAIQRD